MLRYSLLYALLIYDMGFIWVIIYE